MKDRKEKQIEVKNNQESRKKEREDKLGGDNSEDDYRCDGRSRVYLLFNQLIA